MGKTLLYRLFGAGKIPQNALPQIRKEGIVLQDEGIGGSVTFRKFRAPGKRYSFRRNWFSGSIILTRKHFLAFQFSKPVIGVSWKDAGRLTCSLEDADTLWVHFDASEFNDDWSGDIEVRFSTPLARSLLDVIEQKRGQGQLHRGVMEK